jgi:hypothetical protein
MSRATKDLRFVPAVLNHGLCKRQRNVVPARNPAPLHVFFQAREETLSRTSFEGCGSDGARIKRLLLKHFLRKRTLGVLLK